MTSLSTLHISPEISGIFAHITGVLSEIKTIIHSNSIANDSMILLEEAFRIIEENNIKHSIKKPLSWGDIGKHKALTTVRTEMNALFSLLETLAAMGVTFDEEISDKTQIMNRTRDTKDEFIKKFILTDKNTYYKLIKDRLPATASQLKSLRNYLSHFYSTNSNFILVGHESVESCFKSVKQKKEGLNVISSIDLLSLLESGGELLFLEWERLCAIDKDSFSKKITCLKTFCNNSASIHCRFRK